jgi:exosortase E/protease (VPEID-CTERM system)
LAGSSALRRITTPPDDTDRSADVPLPLLRWSLLAALLLAELIGFQFRFSRAALADNPRWWAQLKGFYPIFEVGALGMVATVLLARRAVLEEINRALSLFWSPWRSWQAALLGHGVAALGFYGLTRVGLERGLARSSQGDLWFFAWATVLLLTVSLWASAFLPLRFWLGWARRGWRVSLAGLLLGGATVCTGLYAGVRLQHFEVFSSLLFSVVGSVLRLLGYETVLDPPNEVIGTRAFAISLGGPCRGYEGVVLVVAFAALYLWACRRDLRWPGVLWILPLGAALSYAFNIARVVLLILIGSWRGELAVQGFHSVAGWFSFAAVGLAVVAASQRWWATDRPESPSPTARTSNPAAFYLLPLLAIIATTMLTRIIAPNADTLYPLRVAAAATVLWMYRGRLAALRWRGWGWGAAAGVATFVMWIALDPSALFAGPNQTGLARLASGAAAPWLAVRIIGYVVTVPLAEELAFRGYLMRKLIAADFETVPLGRFSWLSFLGSSLLFGALHGRWLAGTLAGMIFAAALYWRRELADPIVAHATVNGLLVACALATGRWELVD